MTPINRKVRVQVGHTPSEDRFITLTTTRVLATDAYIAAVVDGTGKLADPKSLLVSPDYGKARRHANILFNRWGGEEVAPQSVECLPHRIQRRRSERQGPQARGPGITIASTVIDAPRRVRDGSYAVRWQVEGQRRRMGRRFPTEAEARSFHAQLRKELNN